MKRNLTRKEVADEIEAFLTGTGGNWDWDDFISIRLSDPHLEEIRKLCGDLPAIDPPTTPGHYCGDRGLAIMAQLVNDLRAGRDITDLSRYRD